MDRVKPYYQSDNYYLDHEGFILFTYVSPCVTHFDHLGGGSISSTRIQEGLGSINVRSSGITITHHPDVIEDRFFVLFPYRPSSEDHESRRIFTDAAAQRARAMGQAKVRRGHRINTAGKISFLNRRIIYCRVILDRDI